MKTLPEYDDYDALGLADLVRRREVQPRELVEACIERIERHDPALNVMVTPLFHRARKAAALPPGEGPFAGVPYLLKDAVPCQGTPLTLGNALLRELAFVPEQSHPVVVRSERAGLIVVGTTNLCEFGLLPTTEPLAHGPTANPWDLTRSPGGSSGGAAAAVAARIVPMAHGNDGGGSIRIPASACGVFGLKPSRGCNPGSPDDLPTGMVVEHCLSRTVRDSAALLDVTRGALAGDRFFAPAPERPYLAELEREPGSLRIAFATRDLVGRAAHPDCAAAAQRAAALCAELGHRVEEASPPIDGHRFEEAFLKLWVLMPAFFFRLLAGEARRRSALFDTAARLLGEERIMGMAARLRMIPARQAPFEPLTQEMAAMAGRISATDYWLASAEMQKACYELARFLESYDLWLTPVLGSPPVRIGEISGSASGELVRPRALAYAGYTSICNVAGLPAMSAPLHWNEANLPIGVQFVGRFGAEPTLFRLAAQLERAVRWSARRPPIAGQAQPVAGDVGLPSPEDR